MSSAGRAASSSGCVARPRGRETGLTGYAAQIQRSLPTGSSAMETAEHREPYESRGSRTDLGAPGGESPPGDSTRADEEPDRLPCIRYLTLGFQHLREIRSPLANQGVASAVRYDRNSPEKQLI